MAHSPTNGLPSKKTTLTVVRLPRFADAHAVRCSGPRRDFVRCAKQDVRPVDRGSTRIPQSIAGHDRAVVSLEFVAIEGA
jgi:hypothetical protein